MSLIVAPLEALTDRAITDPERRVLLALFSFRGKNTNTVWPSVVSIAERAGVKDHTRVSKLTSSLASKGWLTKKKRGFTGCNEYELTVPERLSNLDSDANLVSQPNMGRDAASNLDSDAKSNLDSDAKYKEQTNEQTNEQTSEFIPFFGDALTKSERFSVLWDWWPKDLGAKGSRAEAAEAWERVPKSLHADIAEAIQSQVLERRRLARCGEFTPSFPHVVRWIRKKRWTDEAMHMPAQEINSSEPAI